MSRNRDDSFSEEAGGMKDRVVGATKDAVGSVTGNRSLEREGEMQNAQGNVRQETNNVFDESDGVRAGTVTSTSSTTTSSTPVMGAAAGAGSGMVTGLFRDRASAERAYNSAVSRGYSKDDISLMMSDDTRKTHFGEGTGDSELGDKALEGAGVGSAIGGTVGAVLAGIAAIGTTIALPGLGLLVAGPLAAALAGAGAGGLTGGLIGALVGSGIPEEHAKQYESGIKEGGIVMGVRPRSDDDAAYFENEYRNSRAENIYR